MRTVSVVVPLYYPCLRPPLSSLPTSLCPQPTFASYVLYLVPDLPASSFGSLAVCENGGGGQVHLIIHDLW